ncbi:MAG TPA: hypothetical protein VFU81_15785, partial [Thermomicrobiales bacterium]|nr:hypothetical protein [Thermomicrobiales bacterium]
MALLAIGIVKNARRSDRAAQRANVAAPAPQAGPSGPQRSPARIFWKFLPGVIVAAGIAAALFAVGIWYVLFGSPYDPFWQSGAICADYVYQEEAAEMFAIAPRSAPDLDQNRNGVACDEAGLPSRDAQLAHPGQTIPPVATPATVGGAVGDLALTARPAGGDRSLRIELAGLEPLAHKGSDRLADRRTFGRVCTRYLSFERIAASVQVTFASPVWIEP